MQCLKMAMRWDEERFGRCYDLDVFHVVATRDFTMGAMENKGLNIFNAKYLVADPEHATDDDYRHVLAVVGHEYFHNWSGNRVTCRDWFQLSLKEGLTVYREQEFESDLASRTLRPHRGRAHAVARAVQRGRGAARASGAAGPLQRDQQFLHRDRLRQGRGDRAHARRAARHGRIPARARSLFRASRRARGRRSRIFSPRSAMRTAAICRHGSAGTTRPERRS